MTTDTQKKIYWTEFDVLRSLLVLEFIRRMNSPLTYCVIGFVLISLMGYLLGLFIQALGYDWLGWGVLNWILGTKDTAGVSYSLSPWMAYPFAGYIIGVAAMHYRGFYEAHRWRVVSGLLVLGGLNSVLLWQLVLPYFIANKAYP